MLVSLPHSRPVFARGPGLQECQVQSSLHGILSTGSDKLVFGQVLDRHEQLIWQDLLPPSLAHFTLHKTQAKLLLFVCSSSFWVLVLAAVCQSVGIGGRHRVSAGIILLLQEYKPPGLSMNTAFLSVHQFACGHFHCWLLIQAIHIIPGGFSCSFTLGCFHPCFSQFYHFGYRLHYDPAVFLALCSPVLSSTWDPLKPI